MRQWRAIPVAAALFISLTGKAPAQRIEFLPSSAGAPATTPAVAHQFVTGFPTVGSPLSLAQPAFTDISGTLASGQCPNGTTLAKGCLQIGGGLSVTTGVAQLAAVPVVSHQWFSAVSAGGVLTPTQPAAGDLSNGVAGSGAVVLATSPTLVTPVLGVATATSINKMAITPPATASTLTIANSKTLTVNNTLTLAGIDSSTLSFGGNFTSAGALTTTGAGPTTLAFPNLSAIYTFPLVTDTLAGLAQINVFTAKQAVNLNTAPPPPSLPAGTILTLQNADAAATGLNLITAATSAGSQLRLYRVDNTVASPSALTTNDNIGSLTFGGFNGSTYPLPAAVTGIVTEPWDVSHTGTQVVIKGTPTGGTSTEVEATFQNGIASGTGIPQGVSTVNAPSGYYVGNTNVINSARAGTFAGLTITGTMNLNGVSGAGVATKYVCVDSSGNVLLSSSAC